MRTCRPPRLRWITGTKPPDRKDANEQYTLNRQLYTAVDTLYTAAADEADSKAKGQLTDLYDSFVSSQMILDRETAPIIKKPTAT